MIICSCNVLTNHDVLDAVKGGASRPREVYAAKGCRAQCGNCVAGLRDVMRSVARSSSEEGAAEATCGRGCCAHTATQAETLEHTPAMRSPEGYVAQLDGLMA